ncbi:AAA domain-containing protein [Ureaplasma parvum]|uniref:AAA domain-containing protein n=1 Tax=Ureaplasma parvum TaxID=134821 RepID=UPI0026F18927|nr:AAA domain-containing protein [Ureaplasma parvum]
MKKAIKQKLMNLVNLNPHDSIILTRLSSSRNIDLFKYIKKEDLISFVNGEISYVELNVGKNLNLFEESLKNALNIGEFLEILVNYNVNLADNKINLLQRDFHANKKKIIPLAIEQLLAFRKKFISINRLAKNYFEDTTVWPLYFAFNFLKGKLLPNDPFKSPLTLFKVEIREEADKIFIAKIQDEPIVNEKIQIFLKKGYQDFKVETTELLTNYELSSTIKMIEDMTAQKININENEFVPFMNENETQILDRYTTFEVETSAVLGLFEPDGGALKADLHKIIEMDVDPFESENDGLNKPVEYYEDKVIKEQTVVEIGRPLNIFQKYAVASSLSQNTLIYGPPGTGKSEVIANIIFNVLLKGKSSLLVSEKRAALDVLTERIGSLSQFALYVYDLTNKETFFEKISNLNDLLGTQWYREQSRSTKIKEIEPIKFTPEESMFFKNYEDWNSELLQLVKKHWSIEDYNDGIYKMDYADYIATKNELGEQIVKEWLTPQQFNEENEKRTTLFEEISTIFNEYNLLKIEDLFTAYIRFTSFIKKYKLTDNYSSIEILKHLKMITNKIQTNDELVTKFLMHANKITKDIDNYYNFLAEHNLESNTIFMNKSIRDKRIFIDKIGDYLKFRKDVIDKDFSLQSKTTQELNEIIDLCDNFFTKHKKLLTKSEWFNFLIKNKDRISAFLSIYNNASDENKQIIFAEFISNGTIITNADPSDESSLSLKEIKTRNRDSQEVIELFIDFLNNIEYLSKPKMDQIASYREFINQDVDFLSKLHTLAEIYTPTMQDIIREWSWLSLPYIKTLYLEPLILFDFEKIGKIMKHVSTLITHDQFKKLKVIVLWDEITHIIPMFSETKGRLLQDIIIQLRRESMRSAKIVGEIVFKKYINNLRNYLTKLPQQEKDEITNALRIASSRSWPSISRYLSKYYTALKRLFPIWVARPDNVASLIPLVENEFDYGIFDEASQMTIERSYPIVYRCKTKVVSGDDKQLKPTSFFINKLADSDFEIDDFDKVDSLLERAKTSWWNEYHLKNHYRSDSKELIEFSNKYIYNNNLEVATRQGAFEKGIDVINVNGIWEKGNPLEAEQTIATLIDNWKKYEKILIVTFNAIQASLVESLLFERMNIFEKGLCDKIENNEIVITNLENVQGNEGDLVILSIAYGPNPEGNLRNNFGPLNAKGGMNRLNVAITRARKKMIVIKSLYGHQIQVSNLNNQNALTFKRFIEYVDLINGELSINDSLESLEQQTYLEFDNDLVKEIYSELTKKLSNKYQIFPNWNIGTKKIDLVIIKKETKEIVKTILLETWKENRSVQIMFEDIDRQYFLEDRGYSTYRIKEYEWYIDKHKIVSRINDSLSSNNNNNKIDYVLWQQNNF